MGPCGEEETIEVEAGPERAAEATEENSEDSSEPIARGVLPRYPPRDDTSPCYKKATRRVRPILSSRRGPLELPLTQQKIFVQDIPLADTRRTILRESRRHLSRHNFLEAIAASHFFTFHILPIIVDCSLSVAHSRRLYFNFEPTHRNGDGRFHLVLLQIKGIPTTELLGKLPKLLVVQVLPKSLASGTGLHMLHGANWVVLLGPHQVAEHVVSGTPKPGLAPACPKAGIRPFRKHFLALRHLHAMHLDGKGCWHLLRGVCRLERGSIRPERGSIRPERGSFRFCRFCFLPVF
eukprot:scaffold3340_cov255-Pinguiococcus_pyrenoidosus.AAC.20